VEFWIPRTGSKAMSDKQKQAEAHYNMGLMFHTGGGPYGRKTRDDSHVQEDWAEAMHWYGLAANLGHAEAAAAIETIRSRAKYYI